MIKITAGETPLPLHQGAAMIIHVVPFSTFAAGRTIDIVQAVATGHVMALPPGRIGHGNNYAANLDGLVTFSSQPGETAHAYAQLFRSGAVEGVTLLSRDEQRRIPYLAGPVFENTIISAIRHYLMFVKEGYRFRISGVFVPLFLWHERLRAANRIAIRGGRIL